jgi:acetoin utilization deacetylase AcuC-like enzyme
VDASGIIVVEDPRYRDHVGPAGHPERPERLKAVAAAIASRAEPLERLEPRAATPDEILRIHDRDHLDLVDEAARQAPVRLDADTYLATESALIAKLAAGGSIDLALAVARGEARGGLAAVRPPGHHAEADRAMGFCVFNNAAIATRAVQREAGVERVLLLDWDVHHGNGSQHSFEEDPSVLYFSTHQFPYYPGTGDFGEAGRGAGLGATVNVPLPAGSGDAEYLGALSRILVPVARGFRPDMIVLSCGFDAHRDDPLAQMQVSADGFGAMAATVRALADDLCGGRLACVLEGGYALSGLEQGTNALLGALLAPETPSPPAEAPLVRGGTLERVLDQVRAIHGSRFRGLGAA